MIYDTDCLEIYSEIKEYFRFTGIRVLDNENNQSMVDFVNIIYNNI
jgi:hypothetical protein